MPTWVTSPPTPPFPEFPRRPHAPASRHKSTDGTDGAGSTYKLNSEAGLEDCRGSWTSRWPVLASPAAGKTGKHESHVYDEPTTPSRLGDNPSRAVWTMKVPNHLRKPLSVVCHPASTVAAVRRAIEIDAMLQRKAGARREHLQVLVHLVGALKRVERGESLAVALNLDESSRGSASR